MIFKKTHIILSSQSFGVIHVTVVFQYIPNIRPGHSCLNNENRREGKFRVNYKLARAFHIVCEDKDRTKKCKHLVRPL